MSLFGNTTSNQGGGLFGASQQQQPQQQQQSGGLFGQSTANANTQQNQSVFANSQQQTGNPLAGTLSAGFGANNAGALGAQSQRELAQ